jgi:hypothetical protein
MKYQTIAVKLYLINLSLLATHEIDSAFWHEWKLFHLPGGINLFLILNLIILTVFLIGFEKVVNWKKGSWTYSFLLSFSGIFAFSIHSYFILQGNHEFTTVISFTILLFTFIISLFQLVTLIAMHREKAV